MPRIRKNKPTVETSNKDAEYDRLFSNYRLGQNPFISAATMRDYFASVPRQPQQYTHYAVEEVIERYRRGTATVMDVRVGYMHHREQEVTITFRMRD